MPERETLEVRKLGVAFQELRDLATGRIVGHNYRWNDGSTQILWKDERFEDFEAVDRQIQHQET